MKEGIGSDEAEMEEALGERVRGAEDGGTDGWVYTRERRNIFMLDRNIGWGRVRVSWLVMVEEVEKEKRREDGRR